MSAPKNFKGQAKNLHLDQEVIDKLSVMAVREGKKNFKNYAEHILTEKSKELDQEQK